MRIAVTGLVMLLLAGACGDDTTGTTSSTAGVTTVTTAPALEPTTTGPSGFEVVSEDGRVVLEVPPGALAEDPGIAITVLAPEEYPELLEGAAQNPGTVIHRLQPAALTFAAPARVTKTFDAANFPGLPATGIPLVGLFVYTPDGTIEQLANTTIVREGAEVRVAADIEHFSTLFAVTEQVYVEARFVEVDRTTVTGMSLTVAPGFVDLNGTELIPPVELVASDRSQSGLSSAVNGSQVDFACPQTPGSHAIEVRWDAMLVADEALPTKAFGFRFAPRLVDDGVERGVGFGFSGPIHCVEPSGDEGIEARTTLKVDHPGGVDHGAADFEFALGASALVLKVDLSGVIPEMLIAHVFDANGNGVIDDEDLIYAPRGPELIDGEECFILPIDSFGQYFFLFLSGVDFDFDDPAAAPTSIPWEDGLILLEEAYRGPRSVEEAVRVPMLGDLPYIGRAFAQETMETVDTELILLVTANIVESE